MKRVVPRDLATTMVALATLLAPVSWGTTYVTITELLPDGRPLLVAGFRVLPAGILLAGYGLVVQRWHPALRDWLRMVSLGLLNFGLFFPLLILAIYRLPGGVAASVGGIQPLLVVAISYLVRREPIRRRAMIVGIVAAAGVGMVVLRPDSAVDWIGVGAALAANLSFATGVVLTKAWRTDDHRVAATGWQLLVAAVVIVPLALVVEGPAPPLNVTAIAGFAYLSLVTTGVAFVLWFRGIRTLPTQAPPLLGLAAPITGATLGWILLGEDLTLTQVAGFLVTIGAISYAATFGSRLDAEPADVDSWHQREAA